MMNNTLDEDWIKTGYWDVRNPDGTQVKTLEQLCSPDAVTVQEVESWVVLPCWQAAPDKLKDEAIKWLTREK